MEDHFEEKLLRSIGQGLPGEKAQYKMAPIHRLSPEEAMQFYPNARRGGVLILFYPSEGAMYTVLIKRPEYKGVHSGQIAFPGGKHEEEDADIIHTALREAEEEVGMKRDLVRVISPLSDVFIPPSNFLVTPVIGFTPHKPTLTPEEREVSEIIHLNVESLEDERAIGERKIRLSNGLELYSPSYDFNGHIVWGATAMMISELQEILRRMK